MENERFDEITKALTGASTRRFAIKTALGGAVASILGVAALAEADAKAKRGKKAKRNKRRKNRKPIKHGGGTIPTTPIDTGHDTGGDTGHDTGGDTGHDCGLYMYDEANGKCFDDYEHCLYGYDESSYDCYPAPVTCPTYDCDYGCVFDEYGAATCAEYEACPSKEYYDYYGYDYSTCSNGCIEDGYGGWICAPDYVACPTYDCKCGCNVDDYGVYSCVEYCPKKCDYGYDAYGKCNEYKSDYDYGYDYGYYDAYGDYYGKGKGDAQA